MSDRLLALYDSMVTSAIQHNVYSNTHPYTAILDATTNPLVKTRPPTINDYTSNAPYQSSFNGDTTDRLVQADVFRATGDLIKRTYTNTHPYATVPNEKTLRFTAQQAPDEVIPQQGQVYGRDFHGGNQYTDKQPFAPIAASVPSVGLGVGDVFAIANWARNIAQEFGTVSRPGATKGEQLQNVAKGVTFLASQFLLASFNPGDPQYGGPLNQIYNPLHLPLSAVPGLRVSTTIGSPTLAAALSIDGTVYQSNINKLGSDFDRHLLMRQGYYIKALGGTDIAQLNLAPKAGFIGDITTSGKTQTLADKVPGVSIQAQVDQDGLMGALAKKGNFQTNQWTALNPYKSDGSTAVIDIDALEQKMLSQPTATAESFVLPALFQNVPASPAAAIAALVPLPLPIPTPSQYTWFASNKFNKSNVATPPTSLPKNDAVSFAAEGNEDKKTALVKESDVIADDHLYMPFTFQDLRDKTPSLLYFRAYLHDGINESFAPNWNSETYYGRVDEVPTYQSTARTLTFQFDVVAWTPSDLPVMWTKLTKLQSLVYPSYDSDKYLQAGPMVRMRIGDLFSASPKAGVKKGLPGYINSLAFDYDDGIWNVSSDFKIPRKVTVSIGFTVIHDGNPGIYQDASSDGAIFGSYEVRDEGESVSQGDIRGIMQTIAPSPTSSPSFADALESAAGLS